METSQIITLPLLFSFNDISRMRHLRYESVPLPPNNLERKERPMATPPVRIGRIVLTQEASQSIVSLSPGIILYTTKNYAAQPSYHRPSSDSPLTGWSRDRETDKSKSLSITFNQYFCDTSDVTKVIHFQLCCADPRKKSLTYFWLLWHLTCPLEIWGSLCIPTWHPVQVGAAAVVGRPADDKAATATAEAADEAATMNG